MTSLRPGRRRALLVAAGALLAAFAGGEWAARRAGLGQGPRLLVDSDLEYRLAPGRWTGPAGQRVLVNRLSMRGGPDSTARVAGDVRVLVVGDSVVYGGAELDQAELATDQLQGLLSAELGRPVEVGNVAAPSWGPPNELAWLRRHGTLDADVVVLVVSSHDVVDAPTFDADPALDPGYGSPPLSALAEWIRTRLAGWRQALRAPLTPAAVAEARRLCLDATGEVLALVEAAGARPVLVLHRERSELGKPQPAGLHAFAERGRVAGVSVIDLGAVYEEAVRRGVALHRDRIHLTGAGQTLLARTLASEIRMALLGGKER
jgi:hypothetical protein